MTQLKIDDESYFWEKQAEPEIWQGLITIQFDVSDFDYWFINLLATLARVYFQKHQNINDYDVYTKMVANTFASELKHTVENDQWESVGKHFSVKVLIFHFTLATTRSCITSVPM